MSPNTGPASPASRPIRVSRSARHAALPRPVGARVRRGRVRVRGRIPDRRIQAVQDPDEPVAFRAQRAIEAHPELGVRASAANPGRDGVDQLGPFDAHAQQVDPGPSSWTMPSPTRSPSCADAFSRRPAVVGQVVERHDERRPPDDRVVRVALVAPDRRGPGVPVVEVEHVDGLAFGPQRLEGGATEQPEPPGVVRVVPGGIPVEALAVEGGRMVHQSQPVAIGGDVEDRDLTVPGRCPRVRDPQDGRPASVGGSGHVPVAREEDVPPVPTMSALASGPGPGPMHPRHPPVRRSWPTARTRRTASRLGSAAWRAS